MQSIALLLTVVLVVSATQFDCESGSIAGSCDIVDRECAKHNSREWERCFPAHQYELQECPYTPGCNTVTEVLEEAPLLRNLDITISLSSINSRQFSVKVQWENRSDEGLTGFEVRTKDEISWPWQQCVCVNDPSTKEVTFHALDYAYRHGTQLTVEVVSLPLYPVVSDLSTSTVTFDVPTTCRDIDPNNTQKCGPPRYGAVPNISAVTSLIPEQPGMMKLYLFWDPPTPIEIIPQTNYPTPTAYYIRIADPDINPLPNCEEPGENPPCFLATHTLNATVWPLNASKEYYVYMEAYVPCSGLESTFNDFNGCGQTNIPVIVKYMPPSSTTSSFPQPTASVTITATSSAGGISSVMEPKRTVTSTSSAGGISTSTVDDQEEVGTVVAAIIFVVMAFILTTAIASGIVMYLHIRQKKKAKASQQGDTTPRHYPPPIPVPLPPPPPPSPLPIAMPPMKPVLLVYSFASPQEEIEAVLMILGEGLLKYGYQVFYPHLCSDGNTANWVEQEYNRAHAVLCVLNREFKMEWDGAITERPVVYSLKKLLHGTLNGRNDLSSKIAMVLPKANYTAFVPSTYLMNVRRYVLDPKSDVVEDVAHFVSKTPTHSMR